MPPVGAGGVAFPACPAGARPLTYHPPYEDRGTSCVAHRPSQPPKPHPPRGDVPLRPGLWIEFGAGESLAGSGDHRGRAGGHDHADRGGEATDLPRAPFLPPRLSPAAAPRARRHPGRPPPARTGRRARARRPAAPRAPRARRRSALLEPAPVGPHRHPRAAHRPAVETGGVAGLVEEPAVAGGVLARLQPGPGPPGGDIGHRREERAERARHPGLGWHESAAVGVDPGVSG